VIVVRIDRRSAQTLERLCALHDWNLSQAVRFCLQRVTLEGLDAPVADPMRVLNEIRDRLDLLAEGLQSNADGVRITA
jgi:hypothetical protein